MVANSIGRHCIANEEGQSVLEIVFILPVLFLFVALLYKVTMAIQMGIVNTQYARSQVYVLTANSPEFPRLQFRWSPSTFAAKEQDRMVLGVADPTSLQRQAKGATSTLEPVPQVQKIARLGTEVKGSTDRGEVKLRNEIRVRNTSGICTQLNSVGGKTPMTPETIPSLQSKRWPFGGSVCQYAGFGGIAIEGGE